MGVFFLMTRPVYCQKLTKSSIFSWHVLPLAVYAYMRKLTRDKRAAIIHALCEGNTINTTSRMCRVSKLTVLRLLVDVGRLCRDYHDIAVRGLRSQRVQVDEIWSFVGCKQKNKERGKDGHSDA